jgi:hypothetical protein
MQYNSRRWGSSGEVEMIVCVVFLATKMLRKKINNNE